MMTESESRLITVECHGVQESMATKSAYLEKIKDSTQSH